jgi:hypothetical protein
MLALTAAIVLLVVGVMFVIAGRIIEDRVDDRIAEVNKDFDASLNRFRDDVKKELDARAGSLGAVPTPTAFPTPTPSPETDSTETPTPTPTPTPSAEASPTATPTAEIRP